MPFDWPRRQVEHSTGLSRDFAAPAGSSWSSYPAAHQSAARQQVGLSAQTKRFLLYVPPGLHRETRISVLGSAPELGKWKPKLRRLEHVPLKPTQEEGVWSSVPIEVTVCTCVMLVRMPSPGVTPTHQIYKSSHACACESMCVPIVARVVGVRCIFTMCSLAATQNLAISSMCIGS